MKKRILIVDDDIMTLKILKKYLEETYDVVTENAGYRFVEKMNSYNADLILLDIEMPVVNGLQAFEELMKNPELKDTPVVFLSGVSNPNLVRELMSKGASGYLVKTIPKRELLTRLEKIFSEEKKNEVTKEILILDGDIKRLKEMRDDLMVGGYKVKVVRHTVEAADHIKNHHTDLFIIGSDDMGAEPRDLYSSLEPVIREAGVIPLVMEESFFSTELLEKVDKAVKTDGPF
ncbi:MAG: response regulator [Lachnospiraceae bacterium]|nr:response regulator [Lachnospiraceae bacterium]